MWRLSSMQRIVAMMRATPNEERFSRDVASYPQLMDAVGPERNLRMCSGVQRNNCESSCQSLIFNLESGAARVRHRFTLWHKVRQSQIFTTGGHGGQLEA